MVKKFHSASEVAALIGCHANTVLRLMHQLGLAAERAGTTYVFDAQAIEAIRTAYTGTRRRRQTHVELADFDPAEYLAIREVALLLALTDRQIWRLITEGHLQGYRWKGLVLVERSQAVALREARIARQRVAAARGRWPGQDDGDANHEKH